MTVKYLTRKKSGRYYYRREVPSDLKPLYGKREIKRTLKTCNESEAIKEAQRLTNKYDAEFLTLRGTGERAEAVKLLAEHGIIDAKKEEQPLDRVIDNPESNVYHTPIDSLMDELRDDLEYYETGTDGYERRFDTPLPFQQRALDILDGTENPELSEAIELYTTRKNITGKKQLNNIQRHFRYFLSNLPQTRVRNIKRRDVQRIIDQLATQYSYDTYKKALGTVKRGLDCLLIEYDINIQNPFNDATLTPSSHNPEKRETFSSTDIDLIKAQVKAQPDNLQAQMAGLLVETGCRCSEVAAIKLSDLNLTDPEQPYISIKTNEARKLKTKQSERDIPLTGISLETAQHILSEAKERQVYAFEHYIKDDTYMNNNGTQAMNKWLKSLGLTGTSHSFRHTLNARLTQAGITEIERENFFGWAIYGKMAAHYGVIDTRRRLREIMKKLVDYEAKQ